MAVPKFRISKAKGRRRQSINMRIAIPSLIACSNCGNRIMQYRICPACGFYKKQQIIEPEDLD